MQFEYYLILIAALAITLGVLRVLYRHQFIVAENCAGLLYKHGKFVELLGAGKHIRWGRGYTMNLLDVRKATMPVAGQEILTADNVGLKVSLFVTYELTDPVKATHSTQAWYSDIHNLAQLALRSLTGGITVESLVTQRADLSAQLLARVQPEAAKIGVTVHAVEVKDVMFPAELKRAFADVLKARQEGQAALERARGESAALRNLANASRLLEGNPALMNLRLLQSLSAAQGAGNTLVLGMPGGFAPLKSGNGHTASERPSEG